VDVRLKANILRAENIGKVFFVDLLVWAIDAAALLIDLERHDESNTYPIRTLYSPCEIRASICSVGLGLCVRY